MRILIERQLPPNKSIRYGIFLEEVVESKIPNEIERQKLLREAAENEQNIDAAERSRRAASAKIGVALTSVLYASMIYFGVPFIGKLLGLYFPVALTRGYFKSAESGL